MEKKFSKLNEALFQNEQLDKNALYAAVGGVQYGTATETTTHHRGWEDGDADN